ncbi:MAG: acyltransferase [Lachnospiraceae bacterium]|nr:acyltransferase [Lachnospiraceae bacterium]
MDKEEKVQKVRSYHGTSRDGKIILHMDEAEAGADPSGMPEGEFTLHIETSDVTQQTGEEVQTEKPAQTHKKKKPKHEIYLDVMRIVAILFVLFSHTEGYELFSECVAGSFGYGFFIILSVFSLSSPMMFFMISGALLLDKEESIKDIWSKRILRIFIVLFGATLMYYVSDVIAGRDSFSSLMDVFKFIGDLYSKERVAPLWYLYAYMGFLITLPFLRPMAKNMKDADFIYMMILITVIKLVLPEMEEKAFLGRYTLNASLSASWPGGTTIFYPLMGYYLHKRADRKTLMKLLPVFWGVTVVAMGVIIYNTKFYTTYIEGVKVYTGYFSWGRYYAALSLFATVKLLFGYRSCRPFTKKVLNSISGCVMGIYIFHPAILDRIVFFGNIRDKLFGELTGAVRIWPELAWIAIIFLTSFTITWILRRIPIVKKYL